jgi:hypothetical protein
MYTLFSKFLFNNTILYFAAFIRRRFNYNVKMFYTDNKTALGEKFNT